MEEKKEEGSEAQKKDEGKEAEQKDAKESAEYKELMDRFLRLAAEFDNYKKRIAREDGQKRNASKAELVRKLLPVIDEFELALNAIDKDDASRKGIELIYSNLMDALKSEGLKAIDTSSDYDPYRHEILLARESDEKPGKIIEIVRKGYLLNDILIRPASVIVAKEKEAQQPEGSAKKENKEEKK